MSTYTFKRVFLFFVLKIKLIRIIFEKNRRIRYLKCLALDKGRFFLKDRSFSTSYTSSIAFYNNKKRDQIRALLSKGRGIHKEVHFYIRSLVNNKKKTASCHGVYKIFAKNMRPRKCLTGN